jgi:hypothetical protein
MIRISASYENMSSPQPTFAMALVQNHEVSVVFAETYAELWEVSHSRPHHALVI